MAANLITLILDGFSGDTNPLGLGYVNLVPSATLTDAPDQMWIPPAPVQEPFSGAGSPKVKILAIDNPGPQPQGWAWTLSFPNVPGHPASFSIQPAAGPASFSATSASPCVFTFTPTTYLTSIPNGAGVQLTGASLPAGFVSGTTYYVVNASGFTFELATTSGGSPIASTSTGSGSVVVAQYNLSSLAQVQNAATYQGYMLQPSGTPSAGQVPVFSGAGEASVATTLTAASVGADATGAAAAVQAASLQKTANLSDLASASTARTNLGLGSAATQPSSAFDAAGAAAAAQAASDPLGTAAAATAYYTRVFAV